MDYRALQLITLLKFCIFYFILKPGRYLFIEQVNRLKKTIADVVDWLLKGEIHFIIGHIHQGYSTHGTALDMRDVQSQLKRLTYHTGFPKGAALTCPVFTQDKEIYLQLLGYGEMANNTLIVQLTDDGVLSSHVNQEIQRFCSETTEGIGYVLKAPFTTNCSYIRYLTSVDDVFAAVSKACEDLFGSIPYVMIQAKMFNRREHKVVCWNGEPQFVCSFANQGSLLSKGGVNRSFTKPPHTELFLFVRAAIARVKSACPALMIDGLFRVDVFKTVDGRMVVNEFESLEANFPCLLGEWEWKTFAFLRLYHSFKLLESVDELNL